jgi:hypothetical protein
MTQRSTACNCLRAGGPVQEGEKCCAAFLVDPGRRGEVTEPTSIVIQRKLGSVLTWLRICGPNVKKQNQDGSQLALG